MGLVMPEDGQSGLGWLDNGSATSLLMSNSLYID